MEVKIIVILPAFSVITSYLIDSFPKVSAEDMLKLPACKKFNQKKCDFNFTLDILAKGYVIVALYQSNFKKCVVLLACLYYWNLINLCAVHFRCSKVPCIVF